MNTTLALTTAVVAASYTRGAPPTAVELTENDFTYSGYEFIAPAAAPHSRWRYVPAARLRHAPRGQRAKRKAARRAHPHGW